MPTLTILPQGKTVEATTGVSILQALLSAGIGAPHQCGGQGKCGSCHIFVHEGRKSLTRIQKLENDKLDTLVGVGSKSRLACQSILGSENVSIELLGFATGL